LDKLIYVGPPDEEARVEMLKMHLLNRPVSDNLDISLLASSLSGYSASDIKFLVDEAARLALRQDQSPITMDLLQNAVKRVPPSVSVGDERRFQSFAERGID
jgi:SpoVK/Ycf46/Vps4 family AAA+-type ATPase